MSEAGSYAESLGDLVAIVARTRSHCKEATVEHPVAEVHQQPTNTNDSDLPTRVAASLGLCYFTANVLDLWSGVRSQRRGLTSAFLGVCHRPHRSTLSEHLCGERVRAGYGPGEDWGKDFRH